MFITARVKAPVYCACGSTLVHRTLKDNTHTLECFNPLCPNVGKVFAAPVIQLEEIKEAANGSH